MSSESFMIGDVVYYTGSRFRDRLNGKKGWLHAPVVGSPGVWVCDFPDTKNGKDQNDSDDYVMPERVLTKRHHATPAEKKHEGPEVQPRRKKKDPEEE